MISRSARATIGDRQHDRPKQVQIDIIYRVYICIEVRRHLSTVVLPWKGKKKTKGR